MMARRLLPCVIALLSVSLPFTSGLESFTSGHEPPPPPPPHVVFIFVDDLGWNDVGYHGSEIMVRHVGCWVRVLGTGAEYVPQGMLGTLGTPVLKVPRL